MHLTSRARPNPCADLATLACLAGLVAAPSAQAVAVAGQGTWQTTLQARDLDGNLSNGAEAYYDTALNITWLADGFQARTAGYQARPWYGAGDSLVWELAVEWADNLVLYGITDWRLPQAFDTGAPGCANLLQGGECGSNVNPASSELAHMFHVTLGNISYLTTQGTVAAGSGLTNTGPFTNVYSGAYWMSNNADNFNAWNFNTSFGSQGLGSKGQGSAVWAVLDGDRGTPLAAVPEPGSWALMAAGTLAMALLRRRRPD